MRATPSNLAVILDKALTDGPVRVRTRKVLLVEDNPVNQRVAIGLLTKRGHFVTVANNGREALNALDENDPFDLVLMDVQMPEMDGLAATARIREREQQTGEHLRIIAMTAHAMKGDRERFLAAGMDAYLPKPVDPQALFELIESPSAGRRPSDGELTVSDSVDADELRQRLGEDDELIAEVIHLFLEDCPTNVDAIAAAIKAADPGQIRARAHALKGSAGTLSAHRLVKVAHTLESLGGSNDVSAARAHFPTLVEEADRVIVALQELQTRR